MTDKKKKDISAENPHEPKLDKKSRRGIMIRLGGYIAKYWPLFLLAIAFTLISNQLSLLGPKYSGSAIDAIAAESGVDFDAVKINVIKMLVCYALSAVMSYILAIINDCFEPEDRLYHAQTAFRKAHIFASKLF